MRTVALFALLMLAAAPVHAETTFSYLGDTFHSVAGSYTLQDRISGTFTIADGFVPEHFAGPDDWTPGLLTWNVTDGHQTLTPADSQARFYWDPADPDGTAQYRLPTWAVEVISSLGSIVTARFSDYGDFASSPAGRGSNDSFVGGSWGTWTVTETVSVPERAILPKLPRLLKFGPGLGLEAALTSRLQHATAWTAAKILGARREGIYINMPSVRVEVAELCSGLQTLLLMVVAAGLIAAVLPARRLPWALSLFVAAILLALEANALRVAGIAIGLEQTAGAMAREWKDWIQMGTTGFALAQLVGTRAAGGSTLARLEPPPSLHPVLGPRSRG